ncbi:hypothetical protein CC2G_008553 [Coprinopsis cinerea AmutBmut pab1-1]|nr:hypothetical protein CC2G_008553 [Coprinopsis cinerea AmutBmut pab1-1]
MVRDLVTSLQSVLTEYQSIKGEFLSVRPEFRQRLQHYTPHVKEIGYTSGKRFDHRSLHALHTSTVPLPLFPNVVEVTLPCFSERPLEAIFYPAIVLSPSIRVVRISTNEIDAALTPGVTDLDNPCWKALSDRLQAYAQNITSFTIYNHFCGGARLSSIDCLLRHFTARLTSLSIDYLVLQPETLPVLSRFVHLKTLSVTVDDSLLSVHLPYDLFFPKLDYLGLSATSTAGLNTFLRKLRVPSLEQFTIEFHVSTQDIDLHESLSATAHCPRSPSSISPSLKTATLTQ